MRGLVSLSAIVLALSALPGFSDGSLDLRPAPSPQVAEQPKPGPGLPKWHYEEEPALGAMIGGVLGAFSGSRGGTAAGTAAGAIGGHLGIELTPSELNALIVRILSSPPAAARQAPAGAATFGPSSSPVASRSSQLDSPWTILESNEGQIITDWRRTPGRKAGVGWWEREYDAEVRHIITIRQSFSAPRLASFSIETEVRERPNDRYPWASANVELGRRSFEELKNTLVQSVQTEMAQRKHR